MKPVERPYFYEKYLHLVEGENADGHLEKMNEDLDEIIGESKSLGFIKDFYPIILLLFIPLVLLTLTLYIKEGWSYRLIPGVASLIFLLFKRSQLKNLDKPNNQESFSNLKDAVFAKCAQGRMILEEKMFKINFLEQLYIGFFPWILFLASYLIIGDISASEVSMILGLAYLISGVVWYYNFEQETKKVGPLAKSIEEIQNIYFKI